MKSNSKKYLKFLSENLLQLTRDYVQQIRNNRICDIREREYQAEILESYYSRRISEYLESLLNNEPLRQIHHLTLQWKHNNLISFCSFHPILPEDLTRHFYILHSTMLSHILPYTHDMKERHYIISELNDLDDDIEGVIRQGFREIQMNIFHIKQ